jgi:hypothetical protein
MTDTGSSQFASLPHPYNIKKRRNGSLEIGVWPSQIHSPFTSRAKQQFNVKYGAAQNYRLWS